jgi:hypothetical protein
MTTLLRVGLRFPFASAIAAAIVFSTVTSAAAENWIAGTGFWNTPGNWSNPAGFPADAYTTWRSHFGQTGGSGSAATANTAVPEPATAVVLIAGIFVLFSRVFAPACGAISVPPRPGTAA